MSRSETYLLDREILPMKSASAKHLLRSVGPHDPVQHLTQHASSMRVAVIVSRSAHDHW